MKRLVCVVCAVTNLVLADAVTKELAIGLLKGKASFPVIPGFFDLAYVENHGCAWGMLQGHTWPLAVFALLALAFLIVRRRAIFGAGRLAAVTEALLYAGIIGNVIDRIFRGAVIDFLDFHWYAHHFPCFNLADVCISVAAGLLVLTSFLTSSAAKHHVES